VPIVQRPIKAWIIILRATALVKTKKITWSVKRDQEAYSSGWFRVKNSESQIVYPSKKIAERR